MSRLTLKELEKRIKSIRQICTFGYFMVDSCTPGHFMVFLAACGFVSCASNHLLRGQVMPFLRPINAVSHTYDDLLILKPPVAIKIGPPQNAMPLLEPGKQRGTLDFIATGGLTM
jgi:hypothetical protein